MGFLLCMDVLTKAFLWILVYAPLPFHADAIYMGSKLCGKRERAVHESVMLTKIKEKKPLVWFVIAVNVLCAYQHCVCPWRKQTLSFLALGLLLVFCVCEKQCRVSCTVSCAASLPAASLSGWERSAHEFSAGGPQPAPCVRVHGRGRMTGILADGSLGKELRSSRIYE